jgi:hypothetical protein
MAESVALVRSKKATTWKSYSWVGCEVCVMSDLSVSINRKVTMHTDVFGTC